MKGDAMPWHAKTSAWCVNGHNGSTAAGVATELARLDAVGELRYRDVRIEAHAVDVAPCHETSAGGFYRLFLLRAVGWPPLRLPERHRLPSQWQSEVISMNESSGEARFRLAHLEAEFTIRAFLCRVEREIDGVYLRAEEHNQSWARR
jgi:hypothetical protein